MAGSKAKAAALRDLKEGREKGLFMPLPMVVITSEEFAALSPYAVKLIFDLASQWHPNRNGYLSAAWTLMQPRGWRSKATLAKALKELEDKGWLIRTRHGGRNQCSLFAFSFYKIDDHQKGKPLDVRPTKVPLSYWRNETGLIINTNATPRAGAIA
ncbi:hypothetical protein K4H28_04365 [Deefgea tanakiae]|uniref:Helix-turn-helix domain-containing protein n=1 Tax=Deefgea tanakiae TaxID=2865840 RepID=A0ABX8ZCQ4_9NEIS|nr:hypothetical protein [Deefgea tanakiae]QZA78649.1 hypothetical protein K4H28_04365 [Deefgea tanakiae]